MINRQGLLKDLQQQLPKIEQDILAYSESRPELTEHLREEYRKAVVAKRTADHFVVWREGQITQAAVAWILTCVFVRFLEDNQLLDEPLLAGPGERLKHAKGRIEVHFNENPTHGERDYLLALFAELEKLPAIKELLDHQHNPLWQIPVSSDGGKLLVDFFQKIDPKTGEIIHDFTDDEWDTRFLGDLYQDLSIAVRKKYALLQTPEFVESFILDYTLEKAKDTFGLKGLRMIDPTCGSGHFLLTGFERIFNDWSRREPTTNTRELAQRALNSVHGVDLNPYAIAICRFRLLIAAMKVSGTPSVRQAPDFHFNLAVGDSLLHGRRFEGTGGIQSQLMEEDDPLKHVYDVEDKEKLSKILGQQYHAVVGNPPYIVVRDKVLNQAYREKYPTCHRKYSLGVPFTERFFDLTLPPKDGLPAGYIGMITANSFMKREFGKKLVESYLPHRDLTHVIDTSGAYIPGHGTPTVIILARNQHPQADVVRAVLGIRGEPGIPKDAAKGKVWLSIIDLLSKPDSENEYVSVMNQARTVFSTHPWSVSGGGASELKELLDTKASNILDNIIELVGVFGMTNADEVMLGFKRDFIRLGVEEEFVRPIYLGDTIRDWSAPEVNHVLFPYSLNSNLVQIEEYPSLHKWVWSYKTVMGNRATFNKGTYFSEGRAWWEWHQVALKRLANPLTITFSFVATHNHFVLDRGGKVFKQSAPIIKLPAGATESDHLLLVGLLNSSTACFWMKQIFHNKGDSTDSAGARVTGDPAFDTYEFTGTGLKQFPIASLTDPSILKYTTKLDALSIEAEACLPNTCLQNISGISNLGESLSELGKAAKSNKGQMVSLQEELDWYCYQLYGVTDEPLIYDGVLPEVQPGERAFEIYLARQLAENTTKSRWFSRHKIRPIESIPQHWPAEYQLLVQKRLDSIQKLKPIRLLERPEYKRRWHEVSWLDSVLSKSEQWMLEHLENHYMKHDDQLITCAGLADRLRHDADFNKVATHYMGTELFDIQKLVSELVTGESIPQMAPARYKPSGITKFRAWQETWVKQRAEDAIDARTELPEDHTDYLSKNAAELLKQDTIGDIPVPPTYVNKDFTKVAFWPLRGKLDVPKERFFSLPGCEKSGDTTPVIGWAGMNHLQRAQAIIGWYMERKDVDGFDKEKLMPMLVALDELVPWLKQWHNELDPEFDQKLGDVYEGFLQGELMELNISRDELLSWTPLPVKKTGVKKTRARKTKTKT